MKLRRRATDMAVPHAILDGKLCEGFMQAGLLAMFLACVVIAALIFSPLLFFGADRWRC